MNGAQAGEVIRSLCDEFGAEREMWKLSPMGKVIDYILLRIGGA